MNGLDRYNVNEDHARLMDAAYRWQRYTYDLTRKYYLFGRDQLIRGLDLGQGGKVLEIGCGTGRNLALVRRVWPAATLYGIDISAEMLKSARARLGVNAALAASDATNFDPQAVFGRTQFDRIIMSYCTSMIPAWQDAVCHASTMIAPGGSLHIVDFGDMAGLPGPLRAGLRAWLRHFHVAPRDGLASFVHAAGAAAGRGTSADFGPANYYQILKIARPQ